MNDQNIFTGIFKQEFQNFVIYKQSLGYYRDFDRKTKYKILQINKYLDSFNLDKIQITEEMTEGFIQTLRSHNLTNSTLHQSECMFRQFAMFLKNQGYKDIYIQYNCYIKNPRNYIPYVFSEEEIAKIFKVIDNLEFKTKNDGKNQKIRMTYQVIFRILYCTGCRLGDITNLKIEDVDLENNVLKINGGKGNVSRLLPFKKSLGDWLWKYYAENISDANIYFFESKPYTKYSTHVISDLFRNTILVKAGIESTTIPDHKRGACVHSLRHTFACNSLDQMIKQGKDPYCALPYLSFYMGHTSVVNTEIYLRMTKQRYNEVLDKGHYIYEEGLGEK